MKNQKKNNIQKEDVALAKLMKEADRTEKVSKETIMKKLKVQK